MPPPKTARPSAAIRSASPAEANALNPTGSVFREGERAFSRDLPALLTAHAGRWIAYLGAQRLDVADSSAELYQKHASRGTDPKDLFIELVHPDAARADFSLIRPSGRGKGDIHLFLSPKI